jgi:hypothetical protein
VSWQYGMANILFVVVENLRQYGRSPPCQESLLHLLCESAFDNSGVSPSDARLGQVKQSALATDVLRRLPLFEDASVSEILDIRRELQTPLIRFRRAIMDYAGKIKSASWDEDFSIEAEAVFRHDIEPSVLEIEDAIKTNPSLLSLATGKVAAKQAVFSSVFTFLISQAMALPYLTAMAIAAGVGSAVAFNEARQEWLKQQQAVEGNQLYFYYRANQFLAEGTHQRD